MKPSTIRRSAITGGKMVAVGFLVSRVGGAKLSMTRESVRKDYVTSGSVNPTWSLQASVLKSEFGTAEKIL